MVLRSIASNKIEIEVGDWEDLRRHRVTHKKTPARVIALVNSAELNHPAGISVAPKSKSVLEFVSPMFLQPMGVQMI